MSDYLELLREKTEAGDLNSILKANLGGYTKKSVLEYLSFVKKQQQSLREAYTAELERVKGEKEALQTENAGLQSRLDSAEADYRRASEAEKAQLQAEYAALEKDMDEAVARIKADEERFAQLEREKEAEAQQSQAAQQTASATALLLDSAQARAEEMNRSLARKESELEALRETAAQLRSQLAEDKSAPLREQLTEQAHTVSLLKQEIALRDRELENRTARLETLRVQTEHQREAAEAAAQHLQEQAEQNAWLLAENEALGQRLERETAETLSLTRENARLRASNAILQQRLEAAALLRPPLDGAEDARTP